MIVRNRPDRVVMSQIVLESRIIPLPSHHVVRTKLTLRLIQLPNVLVYQAPVLLLVLKPGSRVLEMTRIGQPVSSDRSELRQPEMMPEYLSHPTLDFFLAVDRKFYTPGDHQKFLRIDNQPASQGSHVQSPTMGQYQEISI